MVNAYIRTKSLKAPCWWYLHLVDGIFRPAEGECVYQWQMLRWQ